MLDNAKEYLKKLSYKDYIGFALQIIILIFVYRYFSSKYVLINEAAQYTHPGMDDYWMSNNVHDTWNKTQSIFECIKCSFLDAIGLYKRWDGNILSMFLTGLSPVAFNEDKYYLVFSIAFVSLAIGAAMVAYSLLHRRWKLSILNCISICMLFLIFYTDFAPAPADGVFWWPGIANYNIFFGMLLFAQGIFILYWEKYNVVWLSISSVVFFMVGLGNPMTGLVNVCLLAYEVIYEIYRKKSFRTLSYIPLLSALVGLIIVVVAPGNKARIGNGTLSLIDTVLHSFKYGTLMSPSYIRPVVRFYFIMLAAISVFGFIKTEKHESIEKNLKTDIKKIIETLIYVIMIVCLYYASYAPVVYTKCEWYGRILNTTYFVYFMAMTAAVLYLSRTIAYFLNRFLEKHEFNTNFILAYVCKWLAGIAAVISIAVSVNKINNTWDYYFDSLSFQSKWALEAKTAQLYDEQRDMLAAQLNDPDVSEVHVGEIAAVVIYPDIYKVIDDMQSYYNKKIIVD